jgi:endonuclease III-like uncharacterized protein
LPWIPTFSRFAVKQANGLDVLFNAFHAERQHCRWRIGHRIELEALPGVGRKTANVVLNTAFGWPTIAVDTHIFRGQEPQRGLRATQV